MKLSAGLLLHRVDADGIHVLLGHPGGPFFTRKDDGHWTVPKGLVDPDECLYLAARREFVEETGVAPDTVPESADRCIDLGEVTLRGGKRIRVWSFAGDCDPGALCSNAFEIEWPPRSGRRARFPELDRYGLFPIAAARVKIHPAQRPLLERLEDALTREDSDDQ